jgi:hypothetical protein
MNTRRQTRGRTRPPHDFALSPFRAFVIAWSGYRAVVSQGLFFNAPTSERVDVARSEAVTKKVALASQRGKRSMGQFRPIFGFVSSSLRRRGKRLRRNDLPRHRRPSPPRERPGHKSALNPREQETSQQDARSTDARPRSRRRSPRPRQTAGGWPSGPESARATREARS